MHQNFTGPPPPQRSPATQTSTTHQHATRRLVASHARQRRSARAHRAGLPKEPLVRVLAGALAAAHCTGGHCIDQRHNRRRRCRWLAQTSLGRARPSSLTTCRGWGWRASAAATMVTMFAGREWSRHRRQLCRCCSSQPRMSRKRGGRVSLEYPSCELGESCYPTNSATADTMVPAFARSGEAFHPHSRPEVAKLWLDAICPMKAWWVTKVDPE